MEGQKSQAKLTRTNSSLLRSSPTIRSSIQSLSSVSEISPNQEIEDLEEQKPHSKPCSPPVRSGPRNDIPASENLLLVLVFVAILLFFVSRKMALIRHSFTIFKHMCDEYGKRVGYSCFASKSQTKPVQWFIGEANFEETEMKQCEKEKIVGEGVEFYTNGDFYEGESHKGKCNGSGVYNYFVNGRYEGDWVDGRYDGYGIESWAKGSRYRGQYRLGLRHGYGVYKFYTGILTLESGVMVRVMELESRLVQMGAVTLGNSSVGLNMALAVTISEMEIDMQENILTTKFTVSGSITLPMVIVMKGHGMKAASKVMAFIPSEIVRPNVVNGMVAI